MTGVLTLTLLYAAMAQTTGREVPYSGAGVEIHIEAAGTPSADPDARLQAVSAQWETQLGQLKPGPKPATRSGPNGTFTALSVEYGGDPKHVHSFLTTARDGSICHVRAAVSFSMVANLTSAMQRCMVELQRGAVASGPVSDSGSAASATPMTSSNARSAPAAAGSSRMAASTSRSHAEQPPVSADQPPRHPENWDGVQEVYFRTGYGGGAGGMLMVKFIPVIFFKDGSTYEVGEAALEDLDLDRERRDRSAEWGTWRQDGDVFTLADEKGRPITYKLHDGQLFRAYAAEKGGPLYGKYKNVSGGGNSALGGELSVLTQSGMTFTRDGHFQTKSETAIVGNGNNTGVSIAGGTNRGMAAPGTYRLSRHTLELHFPDGRSQRQFFAYSSSGADAHVSRDMIFIGDSGYTTD